MTFFVRHGTSLGNVGRSDSNDCGLTAAGYAEAVRAARELRGHCLIGYSGLVSPVHRCRKTAGIISEFTGLNFVVIEDLRDWSDAVCIDDKKFAHESSEQVEERCTRVWQRILGAGHKFVVVSHAAPIAVLLQLTRGEKPNAHAYHHVGQGKVFEVSL